MQFQLDGMFLLTLFVGVATIGAGWTFGCWLMAKILHAISTPKPAAGKPAGK